ncbi:hypothetical protein AJ79_10057 [Helicocarpus griseus UAMH5409]|uniref:Uncharacterized protein n=1 Tax=Helicocarpus griseus UAMH5409 TaxID=1447875 RepID=A0A2B7WFR4_9EURO|nr:hypothetical protein AJ79_10057 [Helicocarpus griseus UAMH5409]
MAKAKAQKGSGGAGQNHIRARISFLYKASTYLQSASVSKPLTTNSNRNSQSQEQCAELPPPQSPLNKTNNNHITISTTNDTEQVSKAQDPQHLVPVSNFSRQFASQMRGVSLKSQLRLPRDIKRSICKRCDSLLIPNATCVETIENASRGGSEKKPWADVRVVRCNSCGNLKRYPLAAKRGVRLAERKRRAKERGDAIAATDATITDVAAAAVDVDVATQPAVGLPVVGGAP